MLNMISFLDVLFRNIIIEDFFPIFSINIMKYICYHHAGKLFTHTFSQAEGVIRKAFLKSALLSRSDD